MEQLNMLNTSFQCRSAGCRPPLTMRASLSRPLYQFNVVVPVTFSLGGVAGIESLYTAVRQ